MPTLNVQLNTATQGFHSNPRQRMRMMSCASFIHLHSQRNKWNGSVFQATHNIMLMGPSITLPFSFQSTGLIGKFRPHQEVNQAVLLTGSDGESDGPQNSKKHMGRPTQPPLSTLIRLVILRLHF